MANTVSILSLNNNFNDWLVQTNSLAQENNTLAANNYTKSTGTLFLNDRILGLQVSSNSIFGGPLQVLGLGSYAYVQNNLTAGGQVYFNYNGTGASLTTLGQANIGGPLLALSSGTGLTVSNNAVINGSITVNGLSSFNNTVNISGITTISNNLIVSGNTNISNSAYISNTLNVGTNAFISGNITVNNTANVSSLLVLNTANVNGNLTSSNINTGTVQSSCVNSSTITATTLGISGTSTLNVLQANTTNTSVLNSNTIQAVSSVNTSSLSACTAIIGNLQTTGQFTVGGNFVIVGSTVYSTNTFTLNAGSSISANAYYTVNRGTAGANASIRWNETNKYWDLNDITSNNYFRILTTQLLSDSYSLSSSSNVASSLSVSNLNTQLSANISTVNAYTQAAFNQANTASSNTVYLLGALNTANAYTQSAFNQSNTASSNTVYLLGALNTANAYTQAAFNQANTDYTTVSVSAGSYGGTTAIPVITITANGRISNVTTTSITAGATITDDITTNATRYVMLGTATSGSYLVANTSSAKLQFNPSTGTLIANSFSGNISASNLYGTIPGVVLGNSSVYIGTTSIALNRSSGVQSLTGISIDGNANTVSNGVYTTSLYADPSWITSLSGSKITGNISGNANTVTNGVYTSGSYSDPSWITTLSGSKITGNIAGSAASATTANTLNASNSYQVNSLGVGTAPSANTGEIRATNNITAYYSDERLKNKLGNIESALDKLMTLNGFYYEANETAQSLGYTVRKEVGVSAQEVQKILPEIVVPAPIDDRYLTVHYERLVPLLIEAIKELKQEIDDLKK